MLSGCATAPPGAAVAYSEAKVALEAYRANLRTKREAILADTSAPVEVSRERLRLINETADLARPVVLKLDALTKALAGGCRGR